MRPIRPEKSTVAGKQDPNMTAQERLRKGAAEYLRVYTRMIIPQIESRIEERLLA